MVDGRHPLIERIPCHKVPGGILLSLVKNQEAQLLLCPHEELSFVYAVNVLCDRDISGINKFVVSLMGDKCIQNHNYLDCVGNLVEGLRITFRGEIYDILAPTNLYKVFEEYNNSEALDSGGYEASLPEGTREFLNKFLECGHAYVGPSSISTFYSPSANITDLSGLEKCQRLYLTKSKLVTSIPNLYFCKTLVVKNYIEVAPHASFNEVYLEDGAELAKGCRATIDTLIVKKALVHALPPGMIVNVKAYLDGDANNFISIPLSFFNRLTSAAWGSPLPDLLNHKTKFLFEKAIIQHRLRNG